MCVTRVSVLLERRPQLVTSLGGAIRRSSSYVSASRPSIVSALRRARFQQVEDTSSRLPVDDDLSQFGHVSNWTDWLALTGFVELSYSPHRLFHDTPRLIRPRFRLSPVRKLPPPDELNKPYGAFTRIHYGLNPSCRIFTRLNYFGHRRYWT